MMKYLLFQLYGPLEAWGLQSPGLTRRTDNHPSKSAILGLVANSLGITSEEEDELMKLKDSIGFACREDAHGTLLKDYHTIQILKEGKKPDTIVSNRYYLCDACFTICLWEKSGSTFPLEKIAEALKRSVFLPFLGRKSCVLGLPPNPKIMDAKNLREAFDSYKPDPILSPIFSKDSFPVYWEGEDESIHATNQITRYDSLASRRNWRFRQRIENVGVLEKEDKCTSV